MGMCQCYVTRYLLVIILKHIKQSNRVFRDMKEYHLKISGQKYQTQLICLAH